MPSVYIPCCSVIDSPVSVWVHGGGRGVVGTVVGRGCAEAGEWTWRVLHVVGAALPERPMSDYLHGISKTRLTLASDVTAGTAMPNVISVMLYPNGLHRAIDRS